MSTCFKSLIYEFIKANSDIIKDDEVDEDFKMGSSKEVEVDKLDSETNFDRIDERIEEEDDNLSHLSHNDIVSHDLSTDNQSEAPKSADSKVNSDIVSTESTSSNIPRHEETVIEEKEFQCPVCFNKTFMDEILLSNHVEECLSKQAISTILKSEVSTYSTSSSKANVDKSKKRKANEIKKKPDKRCKVEASKNQRIDAFFKLKSRSTDIKL